MRLLPRLGTARPPRPRVVVVTGASSGIGLATVLEAAEAGDHVVLAARDEPTLKEAADRADARGAASTLVEPTDVADDDEVAALVIRVLDRHGRIDAFVNSAGVVAYGRHEEVPVEVFDGVVRTNLLGSANVARHVLPVLRRQERGHLVLVGSVIGHLAVPTMSPYVVSKWGVRALARQLQLENRDLPHVHVGYVAPGGVSTPIYEQAGNYTGDLGMPPTPVLHPDRVAHVVMRLLDVPRKRVQVGPANDLMRFGFSVLPGVYDALVGPLFGAMAKDHSRPVDPTSGNVLSPQPDLHRLLADRATAVVAVPRNLAKLLQGA